MNDRTNWRTVKIVTTIVNYVETKAKFIKDAEIVEQKLEESYSKKETSQKI